MVRAQAVIGQMLPDAREAIASNLLQSGHRTHSPTEGVEHLHARRFWLATANNLRDGGDWYGKARRQQLFFPSQSTRAVSECNPPWQRFQALSLLAAATGPTSQACWASSVSPPRSLFLHLTRPLQPLLLSERVRTLWHRSQSGHLSDSGPD